MSPEVVTRFTFNDSYYVEFSDGDGVCMITIYNIDEEGDPLDHSVLLDPDEIDIFISTLQFYKKRLLSQGETTDE